MKKAENTEAERIASLRARMEKERLQRLAKAARSAEMTARREERLEKKADAARQNKELPR